MCVCTGMGVRLKVNQMRSLCSWEVCRRLPCVDDPWLHKKRCANFRVLVKRKVRTGGGGVVLMGGNVEQLADNIG